MNLAAYELKTPLPHERQDFVLDLLRRQETPLLVLNTCQRLECFGCGHADFDDDGIEQSWESLEAFERLTRIAAGLESRILGELEVLGQVRSAYKYFTKEHGQASRKLDRIFQDAIALARKARRESGIDQNLTSLSGLAARELLGQVSGDAPVAVVGTGSIASSVARYLGKRGSASVRVSSRCPDKAASLAMEVGGFGTGLDELAHLLDGVGGVVTATAAPHPVLYPHHIEKTKQPLVIIDLGVPADCHEDVQKDERIDYIDLSAIESMAQVNTEDRRRSSEVAGQIIADGARVWVKKHTPQSELL